MGSKVGQDGEGTMEWTEGKNGGAAFTTAATPQSACQAKPSQGRIPGQEHRVTSRASGCGVRARDSALAGGALPGGCCGIIVYVEESAGVFGRIVGEIGAPDLFLAPHLAVVHAALFRPVVIRQPRIVVAAGAAGAEKGVWILGVLQKRMASTRANFHYTLNSFVAGALISERGGQRKSGATVVGRTGPSEGDGANGCSRCMPEQLAANRWRLKARLTDRPQLTAHLTPSTAVPTTFEIQSKRPCTLRPGQVVTV